MRPIPCHLHAAGGGTGAIGAMPRAIYRGAAHGTATPR